MLKNYYTSKNIIQKKCTSHVFFLNLFITYNKKNTSSEPDKGENTSNNTTHVMRKKYPWILLFKNKGT